MIIFRNIYNGEEREVSSEPHIAAFWGSSDRSPNISQGQDKGWRLDPEVQVELENIMRDAAKQDEIAREARIVTDSMKESDILVYISERNERNEGFAQKPEDFEAKYQVDLNKVREAAAKYHKEQEKVQEKKQGGKPQSVSAKIEDKSATQDNTEPKDDDNKEK